MHQHDSLFKVPPQKPMKYLSENTNILLGNYMMPNGASIQSKKERIS